MDTRRTRDRATADDNVRAVACDVAVLRWVEPCWDALPDRAKAGVMADLDEYGREVTSHNTSCIENDEYRVSNLNRTETANQYVTELALGTGGGNGTAYSDRSLNTHHYQKEITEYINNGTSLLTRTFVARDQANNESDPSTAVSLDELGLYAGSYFLNHATYTAVEKDNSTAVTYEVELIFDTDTGDA